MSVVPLDWGVKTIRPGRKLFCKTVVIGDVVAKPALNLLWVHGFCASSAQFDLLIQAMAISHPKSLVSVKCYLYDGFGCGESPFVEDASFDEYSTEESVLDLLALYQSMDKGVPTVLIGHSYAPTVISRFLLRCSPDNVVGLVFMSSAVKDGPSPIRDGGHPIFVLPVFVLSCLQDAMTRSFCDAAYDSTSDPSLREAAMDSNNRNDMKMCKYYAKHVKSFTSKEAIEAQGQRKALVIHGRNDGIVPLSGGEHLSDVLNAKLVVVHDASHQLMEERPNEVAEALWSFLESITARHH